MKHKNPMQPDDPRHGTNNGYSSGCRCVECRKGHTSYMKEFYMRPERVAARERTKAEGLPDGDHRHGSRHGYNLGCRCPQCSAVHHEYVNRQYAIKDQKAAHADRLHAMLDKNNPFHGTTTGYGYGCRCNHCRDAAKAYYTSPAARKAAALSIRNRKANSPAMRAEMRLRRLASVCIDRLAKGYGRQTGWIDLLGCTYEALKDHIERQFKPGMTWSNKSKAGWGVDHIKPCVCFDLTDPEQVKQCFRYTNMQPLWYHENLCKNSEWEGSMCRKSGNKNVNKH